MYFFFVFAVPGFADGATPSAGGVKSSHCFVGSGTLVHISRECFLGLVSGHSVEPRVFDVSLRVRCTLCLWPPADVWVEKQLHSSYCLMYPCSGLFRSVSKTWTVWSVYHVMCSVMTQTWPCM